MDMMSTIIAMILINCILLCYSYNINTNTKRINFNNNIKCKRNIRIYLRNDDNNNDDNDNSNDDDFDGTFEERINKKYNKRYPSKSKRSNSNVNSNSNIPFLFGLNRWEVKLLFLLVIISLLIINIGFK